MLLVYFHCVGIILPLEKSLTLHLNKSENSSPKDALLDDIPLLSEICVVWYVAEVSSWFFDFCEILGYFASLLLIFMFKVINIVSLIRLWLPWYPVFVWLYHFKYFSVRYWLYAALNCSNYTVLFLEYNYTNFL